MRLVMFFGGVCLKATACRMAKHINALQLTAPSDTVMLGDCLNFEQNLMLGSAASPWMIAWALELRLSVVPNWD